MLKGLLSALPASDPFNQNDINFQFLSVQSATPSTHVSSTRPTLFQIDCSHASSFVGLQLFLTIVAMSFPPNSRSHPVRRIHGDLSTIYWSLSTMPSCSSSSLSLSTPSVSNASINRSMVGSWSCSVPGSTTTKYRRLLLGKKVCTFRSFHL